MERDDEIAALREQIAGLQKELAFWKTHPTLAQGIKGEIFIAHLTGGTTTGYTDSYDIDLKDGRRVEAKLSRCNNWGKYNVKRWVWSNLLGGQKRRKKYDFLLLMGEKDPRYDTQYPADSPYVLFLVPQSDVKSITNVLVRSSTALSTNLATVRAQKGRALIGFLASLSDLERRLGLTDGQPIRA